MRSRTGCLTCRTRKLKCDEQKPQCSQCRKGNRECRPSEGIVFRHQQNASMNNASTAATTGGAEEGSDIKHDENRRNGRGGSLKGFYSYKNTFNEDNVWLEIPKQVVFVDNSDPYSQDFDVGTSEMRPAATVAQEHHIWEGSAHGLEPAVSMQAENHGLEALSAVATHDRLPFHPVSGAEQNNVASAAATAAAAVAAAGNDALLAGGDFELAGTPSAVPVSSAANNNIRFLLNPSHRSSTSLDPNTNGTIEPGARISTSARPLTKEYEADVAVETEHETAFLLRHFSEAPGLWMDLFDLGTYFASRVPVRAVRNPLLKNAACAYAAKQLGRVKGAKAPIGGVCSNPSVMETWPGSDKVDWFWHGAKYYEKAIQLLMRELQPNVEPPPSSSGTDGLARLGMVSQEEDAEDENPRKRRRSNLESRLSGGARSDDVLAATAILSLYEFHDATDPAWSRHLSGVKSLLDVTEAAIQPLATRLGTGATSHHVAKPRLSRARKATFWNFARQDYLAAFINKTQTRLDTDDLTLWTDAGVQLDDRGFVRPSNTDAPDHSGEAESTEEDVICNALIYISSKIVNFINGHDAAAPLNTAHNMGLGHPAASKHSSLERWHRLEAELNAWHDGLSDSFQPCARIHPNRSAQNPANADESPFSEIWYSIPMCGSCMQHYHMARILLLLHKPGQSTVEGRSAVTGLAHYSASVTSEIRQHSYEICGISMSRSNGAVRIHSLQPLFVSGQCLTDARERRAVVRLMRGIETDLGWATEYRVKQLCEEWGWADETG